MSDRDVGRFGRWAGSYNRSVLQRLFFGPLQEYTLRTLASHCPDPESILDIGCGTGLLLARAARRFPAADLTGVDPAEAMVRVARATARDERVDFLHGFAEQLPVADASVDAAVTTMSFHHWQDQPAALREVRRALRPGGVFALADAFPTGWLRRLFARSDHGRFHQPDAIRCMLEDAGFVVERFARVPRLGGTVQVVVATVPR